MENSRRKHVPAVSTLTELNEGGSTEHDRDFRGRDPLHVLQGQEQDTGSCLIIVQGRSGSFSQRQEEGTSHPDWEGRSASTAHRQCEPAGRAPQKLCKGLS